MLKRLSQKLAKWCCQGSDSEQYEVAAYGIEILLDTLSKFLLLFCIAYLSGALKEMLISIGVFSSLRYFAGGKHMTSNIGCFLSMLFIYLFSLTGFYIGEKYSITFSKLPLFLFLILLVVLVLLYAPAPSANNPITDTGILHKKKIGSVLLTCIFCIIIFLIQDAAKILVLIPLLCEIVTILPIVNYRITREEV